MTAVLVKSLTALLQKPNKRKDVFGSQFEKVQSILGPSDGSTHVLALISEG